MKRRWIVLLLLFMTIGAAGYGFTREEAQKVQKTSSLKIQAVYLECESEEANPLLEDAVLEVNRAVEEHFAKMQEETGYVEAYHNLHVYTKEGKDADTYVTFVTYDMKIRGIYTEVPASCPFLFLQKMLQVLVLLYKSLGFSYKKRKGQDAGNLRSKRE